ncbi:DoxX family protein [Flavobacterium sp. 5]|uniref:DoxX family protein n=1 Tax=Flavobacterium sp. 5 TaxID=2035199 RepID=UPI000C2BA2E8|nr:DoxX family membrane protein [Flavobacterium sp. 5]PKB16710.1 thiosulfate dehydrogenase [quinone] large subunit [Flavobacterium sp. 5]
MNTTVYFLLRLAIGASMFGHGLVRIPKLQVFSSWMVGSFEKSLLPKFLVIPFSYSLPIAELIIGLLLSFGLFTKPTLVAAGIVMVILVFGTALIENWEAIPSQLIHAAFFALLLQFIVSNTISLDSLIK